MAVHTLAARDASVTLDLAIGHIAALTLPDGNDGLKPLHRAPWAGATGPAPAHLTPGIAGLSGDFFCAPFGASDLDDVPNHGWSANSGWTLVAETHNGD